MDLLWGIKSRRSIRKYLQKPLEFDKLTAIIEAGHYAPSAGNIQDWKFVLITDKGLIENIGKHCMEQYWMATAGAMICVVSNEEKCERQFGLRGKRLYTVQDNAAAIENMLLAAHALGLGACWVGAFDEEYIGNLLGIPDSCRPQAIITLGYPDEKPEEKELASLQTCVYFNSFGNRLEKAHLMLRDYSVEWEQQAEKVKPKIQQGVNKIKEGVQKLKNQLDEQRKKREE